MDFQLPMHPAVFRDLDPRRRYAWIHRRPQRFTAIHDRLSLDVDAVVLWTLHQHLGFGVKRLHRFYLALAAEHRRMHEFYQMDDTYPERYKLKELGADLEEWQKEVLADDPETVGKR